MKSKKIWVVISFIFLIGTLLNGCATIKGISESSGDDTQFSYEVFNISKKDFDLVAPITAVTFDQIKSYKERLLSYKIGDASIGIDTESEIRRVFTNQLRMSSTEARNEISDTKSVGNNVFYYDIAEGDNLMEIAYLERL